MSEKTGKILGVFFTYGVSLATWKEKGMLQREITYYQALAKNFSKVYFFTYGKEETELVDSLAKENIFVKEKTSWLPNFFYSFFLPSIYKKEVRECSVYKTNQMFGSWTGVLAKKLYKKKLIVRTGFTLSIFAKRKNKVKFFVAKWIESIALGNGDKIIVATENEKNYFSRFQEKITVIPNFVDTTIFFPYNQKNIDTSPKMLLFVGRLTAQKNLENLLLALVGISNIRLQIIGSGELKESLISLAKRNQLSVEFLGNMPYEKLPNFINAADIFVVPSLYEGNPKVLLEAMACGAPVLATKVPGIENIITHKENGYLCDITSQSLHSALEKFLIDTELQRKVGQKAAALVRSQYSLESILEKEFDIYKGIDTN